MQARRRVEEGCKEPQLTISSQVCKHQGVKEVVICEIDEDVISYSKKYLPSLACGYDDPRVTIKVMDGAEFMRQNPGVFDVIITDSSDPIGPASVLFEAPFYRGMYDALADGGIICTQGECMWLHKDLIKPLVDKVSEFCSTGERGRTALLAPRPVFCSSPLEASS